MVTQSGMSEQNSGANGAQMHMPSFMTWLPGHLPAPPVPAVPVVPDEPPVVAVPAVVAEPPVPAVVVVVPPLVGGGATVAGVSLLLQATTEEPTSTEVAAATRMATCLKVIFTCNILYFGAKPRGRLDD